ncbi:TPA: hypothetical protein ACH3X3_005402 [Trebouxia sp. C0006]
MRIEQLLKKLQSSCCEPDFTQEERAENRGEALKTLITEISAAVMTALSEFIDEIDQNLPITAELVGKFDAHCTRPRPARVVVHPAEKFAERVEAIDEEQQLALLGSANNEEFVPAFVMSVDSDAIAAAI